MTVNEKQRADVIEQLEAIWRNTDEPIERRRKARTAWKNLTSHTARSYGDPANFVSGKR